MTKKLKVADLPDFDMAEMLKTEEDVANYLTLVLEENDMGEFTHALGLVARARGMSAVAEKSGFINEKSRATLTESARHATEFVALFLASRRYLRASGTSVQLSCAMP